MKYEELKELYEKEKNKNEELEKELAELKSLSSKQGSEEVTEKPEKIGVKLSNRALELEKIGIGEHKDEIRFGGRDK